MNRWTLILVALSGVGCWKDASRIEQVVWSDDAAEFGLIVSRWEQKPNNALISPGYDVRNFRHQLYREDATTRERSAVGGEIDGPSSGAIFFMRRGGSTPYMVVSRLEGTAELYELVLPGGSRTLLGRSTGSPNGRDDCSWLQFVPSPDGAVIAEVQRDASCSSQPRVTFKDADSLAVTAGPVTVPLAATTLASAWRPEGDLLVVAYGAVREAYAVDVDGTLSSADVPDCTYPQTTSSSVNNEALHATPSETEVVVSSVSPNAVFGACQ